MNLIPTRASALGCGLVAGVLIAATLTGCSSGQQSQTATQASAVNGASGGVGNVALRDVRIRADQTGAELRPGRTVDLLFVAANQSFTDGDRLLSITSDVGTVTITPSTPAIPANRSLIVGRPESTDAAALQALTDAVKANATVQLTSPVRNGLTYDFVFKFERAGQTTIHVPVTAGETVPRAEQPSQNPEGH